MQKGAATVFFLLTSLSGQNPAPAGLQVSQSKLVFEMVHTGPLTHPRTLSVSAPAQAEAAE